MLTDNPGRNVPVLDNVKIRTLLPVGEKYNAPLLERNNSLIREYLDLLNERMMMLPSTIIEEEISFTSSNPAVATNHAAYTPDTGDKIIVIETVVTAKRDSNTDIYAWKITTPFSLISGTLTKIGNTTTLIAQDNVVTNELAVPIHIASSNIAYVQMNSAGGVAAGVTYSVRFQHENIQVHTL